MATKTTDLVLDLVTARAILSEAAEGGWLDTELPEEEKDLIELAEYYASEAFLWVEEKNPSNSHIDAIIGLAGLADKVSPQVISEPADNTNDGGPPGEIASEESEVLQGVRNYIEDKAPQNVAGYDYGTYIGSEDYERDKKIKETYPRRSSGGYSEADTRDYEGLPIPSPLPEGAPLTMPTDLTDVGDKRVRTLYSAFTSYWGRARWQLGVATNNLSNATHLRDEAYRAEFLKEQRKAAVSGEKIAQATLETMAKNTEAYKEWDKRVIEHEQEVTQWRALADIYGKNVEVLSRDWTMRTEQYERER